MRISHNWLHDLIYQSVYGGLFAEIEIRILLVKPHILLYPQDKKKVFLSKIGIFTFSFFLSYPFSLSPIIKIAKKSRQKLKYFLRKLLRSRHFILYPPTSFLWNRSIFLLTTIHTTSNSNNVEHYTNTNNVVNEYIYDTLTDLQWINNIYLILFAQKHNIDK